MAGDERRESSDRTSVGRRGFLGALASLTAGAALFAPGAVGKAQAETTDEERTKARYTESEHVKRYYETNRY